MAATPEKVEVDAMSAILRAGADCMLFVLQPETFGVFYAWLRERAPGDVAPDYTVEQMREDLTTIYDALTSRLL